MGFVVTLVAAEKKVIVHENIQANVLLSFLMENNMTDFTVCPGKDTSRPTWNSATYQAETTTSTMKDVGLSWVENRTDG